MLLQFMAVSLYPSCAGIQPADSLAALFTSKSFCSPVSDVEVVKDNCTKKLSQQHRGLLPLR